MSTRKSLITSLVLALVLAPGCEDEQKVVGSRGIPGAAKGSAKKSKKGDEAPAPAAETAAAEGSDEGGEPEAPKRPHERLQLTREDFSLATRDPFQNFIGSQIVELEPDRPRAQRDVKLAEYSFEDLKLVAIVRSGRGIVPRALFVASDGKSKAIRQGEYFSRAEVLLAAVNRDYVEIEVVDEELASSLNLARGERRAIYLKNE